jgi:two-component system, NarL family, response regulator DesR
MDAGPPDSATRVLLIDDSATLRLGVHALLAATQDLHVVGECADGGEAVDAARAHRPHVALMDISMPGTDGITATGLVRAAVPACRVLILTMSNSARDVERAHAAGASGYLSKSTPSTELIEAVRTVAQGGSAWSAYARSVLGDALHRTG